MSFYLLKLNSIALAFILKIKRNIYSFTLNKYKKESKKDLYHFLCIRKHRIKLNPRYI